MTDINSHMKLTHTHTIKQHALSFSRLSNKHINIIKTDSMYRMVPVSFYKTYEFVNI